MASSAIYTTNNNAQVLAINNTINLGSVQRRYGKNISLNGNSIRICGAGYYNVSANVTITGTTAGTVGISLNKDGVTLNTTNVSVAVDDVVTVPIQALVREYGCCCDNTSEISFVLTTTAETVSNINVIVEKL